MTPPSALNLSIETGAKGHDLKATSEVPGADGLALVSPDDAHLVGDLASSQPLAIRADGTVYALRRARGAGRLYVLADDRLFTNAALMLADNPEFMVRLLAEVDARRVELVDGLLSSGTDSPAETLSKTRLTPTILQLLALLAALFLWRGVRFGRPRDPAGRSRRQFSEHAHALGLQFARARATRHAARLYAPWALDRLRDRTVSARQPGLYPLAQAIAGRTGDDEARVMQTLVEASGLAGDADPDAAKSTARASSGADDLRLMKELARLVRLVGGPR